MGKLSVHEEQWPSEAVGMKEHTKLMVGDDGKTVQLITRVYRMKDGTEQRVTATEEL